MTNHHHRAGTLRPASGEAMLTTDQLALAAFLLSRGHDPALSVTPSGKVIFQFAGSAMLADDITAFHSGTARVEPTTFNAARIELRRQMDDALRNAR